MSDYTPTTEDVRTRYWLNDGEPSDPTEGEEFDRWLAEHDRQTAEAAWDEGNRAPRYKTNLNGDYLGKTRNPHREQ